MCFLYKNTLLFVIFFSLFIFCPQCSQPCGYGIQSRTVSCMGPSAPEPLSPLLCMHMPKPITIQGCNMAGCNMQGPRVLPTLRHADTQTQQVTAANPTQTVTLRQTASPTTAPPSTSSQLRIENDSLWV